MRAYELARELGVPSRELLTRLHELGFERVTTASSNVPAEAAASVRSAEPEVPEASRKPLARPEAAQPETPEPDRPLARPETPEAVAPEAGGGAEDASVVTRLRTRAKERIEEASPQGRPSTMRRLLGRWTAMLVLWTVFGLGAGFVLAITLPIVQGNRSLTVLSGSMEPAIATGDVVVVEQIPPLDARIGDIVSFRDPDDPSRLITHRVRAMEVDGNEVEFVTKGDSNTSVEQWRITPDGQIGRVVFRVPKIGYVLFYLRGSIGRLLLIVVPALLLGAYELWRIWRPTPPGPDGEERDPTSADAAPGAAG